MIPRRAAPLLLVLAALVLAGCGGGSAGGDGDRIAGDQFRLSGTQRDAQFAVGSEGFTEQEILGQIAIEVLSAADATVIDRTGMGGNEEVRRALEEDEVDLYWEYTATGWLVHLSETRSIPDPQEQYEAVKKMDLEENDIVWLPPAPGNDTYAIAASERTRRDLGVETISDLARLVEERPGEATLCFNNDDDFRSRFDGLPGMERAYGFQLPEHSLLEDDEEFFAVYNPSLNIRESTLDQYPQLEKVFTPISEELDTKTLRQLNHAVDVEGKSPESVATRWLEENGFIE